MNQTISSAGRISLRQNTVPRLEFVDGKYYLDFNSVREICGGDRIARTTLFCLLKQLPNVEENMIRYRNRAYYEETFILVSLRNLIFN
jgi:hypothetical protein